MKKITAFATVVGFFGILVLAVGCDVPPSPPSTPSGGAVKDITVAAGDADELAAVTELERARVNYKYRLEVLHSYYDSVGNMDKSVWAQNELDNLEKAHTFKWEGTPKVVPPEGESVENADERLLAEYVVDARNQYLQAVENLGKFYADKGYALKQKLVVNMQKRFDPVRTYMYFLSAEIPGAEIGPTEVVPEADRMFEQALKLFHEGKGIAGPFTTNYNKERKALMIFRDLLTQYPRSTKVALSAYYIGDIYKEYFDEDIRSIYWYQRAWEWDPNVTEPARFQAATIYDIRLHNHAKAVELYRDALKYDPPRLGNRDYAERRIKELTGQ